VGTTIISPLTRQDYNHAASLIRDDALKKSLLYTLLPHNGKYDYRSFRAIAIKALDFGIPLKVPLIPVAHYPVAAVTLL
jgi:hypothetical protein